MRITARLPFASDTRDIRCDNRFSRFSNTDHIFTGATSQCLRQVFMLSDTCMRYRCRRKATLVCRPIFARISLYMAEYHAAFRSTFSERGYSIRGAFLCSLPFNSARACLSFRKLVPFTPGTSPSTPAKRVLTAFQISTVIINVMQKALSRHYLLGKNHLAQFFVMLGKSTTQEQI